MTTVIGVDLAGKTTNRTVLAILHGRAETVTDYRIVARAEDGRHLPDIRGLVELILGHAPQFVAVDAPLTLPHQVACVAADCGRCYGDDESSYTLRTADRADAWRAAGHTGRGPMPTVMLAGVAFRGIYLRRLLEQRGISVIETWPAGVFRALGAVGPMPSKKTREDEYIRWADAALRHRGFGTPAVDNNDEVDALAAGVTAWLHLAGRTVPIGDRDEGLMWVPERAGT